MIGHNKSIQYKHDLNYGNGGVNKILKRKEMVKQKPAAPEIINKIVNPSFSEGNMFNFSNISSTKTINRPKSMERLKRKQITSNKGKKSSKSKPRKTKAKRNKNEFSTFGHNSSMLVTKADREYKKNFNYDKSVNARLKPSSYKNRRQKLDNEIKKM